MPPKQTLPRVKPMLIPSALGASYSDGTMYQAPELPQPSVVLPKRQLNRQSAEDMLPKVSFSPNILPMMDNEPSKETLVSRTKPTMGPPFASGKKGNYADAGEYNEIAEAAAKKYGVPANLVKAMIRKESSGNKKAVSKVGAAGLMQLMPETAKSLGVTDPFDPGQNIDAGVKYLRQMYDTFGNWPNALEGYNAGPGNVRKYKKQGKSVPFKETQDYLKKLLPYVEE